jgi:hypothetical protein
MLYYTSCIKENFYEKDAFYKIFICFFCVFFWGDFFGVGVIVCEMAAFLVIFWLGFAGCDLLRDLRIVSEESGSPNPGDDPRPEYIAKGEPGAGAADMSGNAPVRGWCLASPDAGATEQIVLRGCPLA